MILDVDGPMLDIERLYKRAWQQVASQLGSGLTTISTSPLSDAPMSPASVHSRNTSDRTFPWSLFGNAGLGSGVRKSRSPGPAPGAKAVLRSLICAASDSAL